MKIVFLGAGAFGLPTLARLHADHELLAIVTQPDRPAGRKRVLTPTPVGAWRDEHAPGVPLLKPEDVNEHEHLERLRGLDADAWVIIAFGQKLSEELVNGVFAINLHASLLPRWRGAAPIHRAIEAGDAVTGNSVITIAQRMDAGLVLGQSRRDVDPMVTAGEMHDLLADDGPDLIEDVLRQHAAGLLEPKEQDESLVTRAKKMTKEEGTLDFTLSAIRCRQHVHGLTPWPGITVLLGDMALKLLRVREADGTHDAAPGTILDPNEGLVACADRTVLQLLEVQPAGKKPMAWGEFSRGRALETGEVLLPRRSV